MDREITIEWGEVAFKKLLEFVKKEGYNTDAGFFLDTPLDEEYVVKEYILDTLNYLVNQQDSQL